MGFLKSASRSYFLLAVYRLLTAGASFVAEHTLQGVQASHCRGFICCRAHTPGRAGFSKCSSQAPGYRLSSCGTKAYLLQDMWDLPGSGIKPMSPALAGRFFTSEPPGKSHDITS